MPTITGIGDTVRDQLGDVAVDRHAGRKPAATHLLGIGKGAQLDAAGTPYRLDVAALGQPAAADQPEPQARHRYRATMGMIRMAMMFATLIIGLIAGPAVSL